MRTGHPTSRTAQLSGLAESQAHTWQRAWSTQNHTGASPHRRPPQLSRVGMVVLWSLICD